MRFLLVIFTLAALCASREAAAFQRETLIELPLANLGTSAEAELITIKSRLAPGEAMPVHCHPFVGSVYVLEGEITTQTAAGETLHKKAGDFSPELLNVWHKAWNPSADKPTVLLVTFAAEKGKPLMFPLGKDNKAACKDGTAPVAAPAKR